ncbi:RNA methyltransferase [Halobacillus shinanisalinarum]|uniref:RNA methyltransferase n=1 Tax=Halobacillus shinanisalinarum TaxID=2932258 RepID=A0ABY4H169_9BACI|nr:RNA methyltransferase [Halobacillus shinanisalinarum]UOQ94089.1 RNA methyltransferase [Halobacillus shinanisalinarum]
MITSVNNSKVKEWKKLHKRKYRDKSGTFLVEGLHLVEEVLKSEWKVLEIIIRDGENFNLELKEQVTIVNKQVFHAVSQTQTPQGIAAIVERKRDHYQPSGLTLLIDSVQDPGNLGTLIRTADAAGFDHVVVGEGSVDPFNEKTIRSTQGSLFHIPVFQGNLESFVDKLKAIGVTVFASALDNATPYKQLTKPDRTALIVGNEGQGIRGELLSSADEKVYIPIYGQAESLNVAIAAAILMYHLKE